jgi:hypothetical protein
MGYCGLDRRRAPLVGDEIRACWEARVPYGPAELPAAAGTAPTPSHAGDHPVGGDGDRRPTVNVLVSRDFVEIESGSRPRPVMAHPNERAARRRTAPATGSGGKEADDIAVTETPATPAPPRADPGWSLWADLEG